MMTLTEALELCEVREADLPGGVNGFLTEMPDGRLVIYVNQRLSDEDRRLTLMHEAGHVALNHLHRLDMSAQECEEEVEDLLAELEN